MGNLPPSNDSPKPYEVISSKIQNIAHLTSLDNWVFPIDTLLPELCQYAVAYEQDNTIGATSAWPVQLFLALGVSHDMIVRVLENTFDSQYYGFIGMVRNRLIEMIVFAVTDWVADMRRRAGSSRGGAIGGNVNELLQRCEAALPPPGHGHNNGGAELAEVRRTLKSLRREVAGLVERVPTGSLRFA